MNSLKRSYFFICCILIVCFCLNLNCSLGAEETIISSQEQEYEFVGQVLNPDGTPFKPSENSYVTVVLEVKSTEIIEYTTNVKDDGTYIIPVDNHYGSEYTITAYARGLENPYASSYVMEGRVNSYCVEHQIRLMIPVVEGRVLDPEGKLLDDYTGVTVSIWLPNERWPMSTRTSAMVNEDGSYKIGSFHFYDDSLQISAHIDYEKNPENEFADGQEIFERDNLWGSAVHRDIRLTKPILKGRVYNSDGTPFNPKKHQMYEIITEPIGGFSNGRVFNTVIDDRGFYRLGGDIVPGTSFVIRGYFTTKIGTVVSSAYYKTSIIPKTIKVSDNITQNVDLFFGEPITENFSFSKEVKTLNNSTYSFFGQDVPYCYSKHGRKIEGQESTKFIIDEPIRISNSTDIEFSNINFTSSAGQLSSIVKCENSTNIIFRNCEFSDVYSVVKNDNRYKNSNISISFINCKIQNIYGDVFALKENDAIYLKECEISNCASLTNIPDAIYDEGNNEIADIGPEKCGALISGNVFNTEGSLYFPEYDYNKTVVVFENIETKRVYAVEVNNAEYAVKEGIPDGRYRVLYKQTEDYIRGIDTGIIVNIDRNISTVQDICINPKNVSININLLDTSGDIFKYWKFENVCKSVAKVFVYNDGGKFFETELNNYINFECELPEGDYMVKVEWYFVDKLLGISEPFDISVGDESVVISKNVQLKPVIYNAAFVGDGWIQNTKTGHYYKNTNGYSKEFEKNEEQANELGGHLVTINNQEENEWLDSIWGNVAETYWIGYYYDESSGDWKWTSNQEAEFTNWYEKCGFRQPSGDEKGTLFNVSYTPYSWEGHESGKWSSLNEFSNWCFNGIIEVDNLVTETAMPTPTPIVTPTSTHSSIIMGDVNSNGKFNSIDFALMRQFLLGKIDRFSTEDGLIAADVNKDNKVNSIDFALMRQYLLGIITEFHS